VNDSAAGTLRVDGASLYYLVRGTGSLLLLLQGGDGGADGAEGLVAHLVDDYTVVTYDRRGLSRSTPDDPDAAVSLERHVDDARQLLTALTEEPVLAAGFSIGAVIGLGLAARSPGQVRTVVAHEPPLAHLLPHAEFAGVERARAEVNSAYRDYGLSAALPRFAAMAGLKYDELEPGVTQPAMTPGRVANLNHFLGHDAPAVQRYQLDIDLLRAAQARIVPAAGAASRGFFPHRCAEELASLLGTGVAEFPGTHSGFITHPSAFAAKLREVLSDSRPA
jgi:pimeloyl-ACP methyl ester carboxylesterase